MRLLPSKLHKFLKFSTAPDILGGRVFVVLALVLASCGALPEYGPIGSTGPSDLPEAGRQISVTTWNVGYGALGADADFLADGGENMRALDAGTIAVATREMGHQVGAFNTQFILLQELASASFLTRNVPVRATIEDSLPEYSQAYWEDLGASPPLQVSHGMGVYALNEIAVRSEEIPQEPGFFFLTIKRYYAAIIGEVPIENSERNWVLINIHLSAFDKDAGVRRAQIEAVFDLAQAEYAKGNYVVIGGDWNMKISPEAFAHTTEDEDLFWVHDFPPEMLPTDWNFAHDTGTPTVRTLHKPYVEGENFTMIIDGFAYSPNVRARDVQTLDLGFEHSDHHPVTARFEIGR